MTDDPRPARRVDPGEGPDPADDRPQAPDWQERDAWTALDDLDVSPALVPAREWPAGAEGLDRPGLFGFWVDEDGAAELARGLDAPFDAGRVYVGQAGATKWPSGRASGDALGARVGRVHLAGKVRGSALRLTLAAILLDQLHLVVQAAMLLVPSSEHELSAWMRAHLLVAVHPHDDRDSLLGLEQAVVQRLDPSLNLEAYLPATTVRQTVGALRKRISREG
jgi:hypothetical protein